MSQPQAPKKRRRRRTPARSHSQPPKYTHKQNNMTTGEGVDLLMSLMLTHLVVSEVGENLGKSAPAVSEVMKFVVDPGQIISKKFNQLSKKGNEKGIAVWDPIQFNWINEETYNVMFSRPIVNEYEQAIQTIHRDRENIKASETMSAEANEVHAHN